MDNDTEGDSEWDTMANEALDRMQRAHSRGTGCRLTREMIIGLSVSLIGSIWTQERKKESS